MLKKKPQPQDDYFKQKYQMKKAIAAALSFDIVTEIEIAQKVELIRNPDEITVMHITLIQRSSSIHVNKKCYKAETCLKFKILFQLLIRWFKDVYRYHLNKKLELFLLVNTFLRDITTAADWKFRAMSYS